MPRPGPYLIGAAAILAALAAGGLAVVELGLFDTRASTPHQPLVAWAAHTTMIHAVQRGAAAAPAAASFTAQEALAGFRLYDRNCVSCHGAPGVARQTWTDGMTPSPPYLLDASRHWSRAELQYIVANGVKMTGMPAWNTVLTPAEIGQAAAFLEILPDLTARDYATLRAQSSPASGRGTR